MRKTLISALVAAAVAVPAVAFAKVTDDMIKKDASTTGDILSWGMGTEGQRFSPLKDINVGNIGKLVPAWSFSFGGE